MTAMRLRKRSTADQQATLALFAQPIMGWGGVAIFSDEPPEEGEAGPHAGRHQCLVILWRGARRKIRPNSDVQRDECRQ